MESLPPILIVDDEADDLFILKRLLHKAGIENKIIAFEEPTAVQAYLEGEAQSPNGLFIPWIVFTDLQMPNINGIALAEWIRSKPALQDIVIILNTSSENPTHQKAAEAAGVDRYLIKYPSAKVLSQIAAEFRPRMKV